ncbi:NAD-dependent epimerase/dehydratase family protein [Nocardiopsis composta]|uniref:Nucleoside-diphosphate-sugar epimerase n=1 Tax=Nocardiopsis composta TaxID=157465 RepID=A0A7W8VCP6_9ACTN|nr:NAD-dependent epimerase/dehydratase family protein [Nocardiopsis composta]MBB5431109.1 nucleoside-diphosphate-sugar epimerase [Nocardiopsis composta]
MPKVVILGGTGSIGRAVARRLLAAGWETAVAARGCSGRPADLLREGARFHALDRFDEAALGGLLAPGADLLVDCLCFTADHAASLLPHLDGFAATVMLSSKAVYVDAAGNHVNSPVKPRFSGPVTEEQPTVAPGGGDYDSAEGYGANKVAAERTLLDSGHPVTVVRASKVHGEGASPPREWVFAKRALDRRRALFLRRGGASVDHTTAAANLAALVQRAAEVPGRRILNSADPDAPNVLEIAQTVAAHFGHAWRIHPAEEDSGLGRTPWDTDAPIVLDTSAAGRLGYEPVGRYAETVREELDWLARTAQSAPETIADAAFTARYLDYRAEDAALAAAVRPRG